MKPAKSESPRWYFCDEHTPVNGKHIRVLNLDGVLPGFWENGKAFLESDVCWQYADSGEDEGILKPNLQKLLHGAPAPAPEKEEEAVTREEFEELKSQVMSLMSSFLPLQLGHEGLEQACSDVFKQLDVCWSLDRFGASCRCGPKVKRCKHTGVKF